jgi:hypothetical protein
VRFSTFCVNVHERRSIIGNCNSILSDLDLHAISTRIYYVPKNFLNKWKPSSSEQLTETKLKSAFSHQCLWRAADELQKHSLWSRSSCHFQRGLFFFGSHIFFFIFIFFILLHKCNKFNSWILNKVLATARCSCYNENVHC